MFVCDECIKSGKFNDGRMHFFKSHGPCEVCGATADCSDIDIHGKVPTE